MTDVSDNLPPGVKPGDSDPPRQPTWTGQVHGSVVIRETAVIRWYQRCPDRDAAIELATEILLKSARERNIGMDIEIGDDFKTEAD